MIRKYNQDTTINLCKSAGKKIRYNPLIPGYIFHSSTGPENYKLAGTAIHLSEIIN